MTVVAAEAFAISDRKEVLREIEDEHCSLAVWQRDVPVDVSSLLADGLENLRILVPSDRPEFLLREALQTCGFPNNVAAQKLMDDVLMLCQNFHELANSPSIEIRLELVSGNSCWKFHSDYVEMRLITTYLGRGTQWIDDRNLSQLPDDSNPEAINELGAGDIGLFKGRLAKGRPAIHRSPPISGTGEKRLLLVLNPISD